MKANKLLLLSAAAALAFLNGGALPSLERPLGVETADAQQMGRQPWGYLRNKSLAAQFQHLERLQDRSDANGGGTVNQYVTTYNSSSTAIGNLTEINQILSGSAQGSLDYLANQTSTGNQGAGASTGVTIDNSTSTATGNNAQASTGNSANDASAQSDSSNSSNTNSN